MMDKKTMKDIVLSWMLDNNKKIDTRVNPEAFDELVRTVLDCGGTREDLESTTLLSLVLAKATHDKSRDPKGWRKMVEEHLEYAIHEKFRVPVSKIPEAEKQELRERREKYKADKLAAEEQSLADKVEAIKRGEAYDAVASKKKKKDEEPVDLTWLDSVPVADTSAFKNSNVSKSDPDALFAELGGPKDD